ncbi:hypothetical protein Hanom_Chr03g00259131 [Helianthus anomalus]
MANNNRDGILGVICVRFSHDSFSAQDMVRSGVTGQIQAGYRSVLRVRFGSVRRVNTRSTLVKLGQRFGSDLR